MGKKKIDVESALAKAQKENLAKRVSFTSKTAKDAQKKSVAAHYKKKALKQVALEALEEVAGPGIEKLKKDLDKCTPKEIMEILSFLAKYAGQEPSQKQDINLTEQTPRQFIFEIVKNAGKKV